MSGSLAGKNIVITGASSGIGREAALEFARRGANLVLAARRRDLLEEVATAARMSGVRCSVVTADVSRPEDCTRLIREAGDVDILVNNAGFGIFDSVEHAPPGHFESMMRTNYLGTVECTQAVLPQMLARRAGTIVNVASIAGIMGYAGMAGYCASKFAIVGFTEALRDEVLDRGIRVAMVCPGTVETAFFDTAERDKIPGASRLVPGIQPERVARAICDAAADGHYRRILPSAAAAYMKMKEIFPQFAHLLMRRVSSFLESRRSD